MTVLKADQITEFVKKNPGSTAKKIADKFGVARKTVNSILYANKEKLFTKNDTNHTWYVYGSKTEQTRTNVKHTTTHLSDKNVVTELDSFPGYALFKIENENDKIKLTLNVNHEFFVTKGLTKDISKKDEVVLLLETLARALEHQYTEIDFIEEIVNDWGYLLSRKISGTD